MGAAWLYLLLAALLVGAVGGVGMQQWLRRAPRSAGRALAGYVLAIALLQAIAGFSLGGAGFAWTFIACGFGAGWLVAAAVDRSTGPTQERHPRN